MFPNSRNSPTIGWNIDLSQQPNRNSSEREGDIQFSSDSTFPPPVGGSIGFVIPTGTFSSTLAPPDHPVRSAARDLNFQSRHVNRAKSDACRRSEVDSIRTKPRVPARMSPNDDEAGHHTGDIERPGVPVLIRKGLSCSDDTSSSYPGDRSSAYLAGLQKMASLMTDVELNDDAMHDLQQRFTPNSGRM